MGNMPLSSHGNVPKIAYLKALFEKAVSHKLNKRSFTCCWNDLWINFLKSFGQTKLLFMYKLKMLMHNLCSRAQELIMVNSVPFKWSTASCFPLLKDF